jgi:hypothetical protein
MRQYQKKQEHKSQKDTDALKKKNIPKDPDPGIGRDFPGHPHSAANEKVIRSVTKKENGEKRSYEISGEDPEDDGSANAFERTELAGDDDE